jgi:signal transduction histidine kinase/Tfp pilus assembly protein PilF
MRYFFSLVFFLGFYQIAIAQDNLPALLSGLKSAKNDSVKAEVYKKIFSYYQHLNPDSARYYTEEGLAYFRERDYKQGIGILTNALGNLESMLGKQELAKVRFREVLKIYQELGDKKGIAVANNGLGITEGRTGNYVAATKYFLKALHLFEEMKDTKGIINTYLKLGTVNDVSNNLDRALDYFTKALELSIKIPHDNNTAYLYNNIGIVYCKKGDVDTGLVCFKKAYAMADTLGLHETKVLSLMHIGNAYKELERYDEALEYYNKALKLSSEDIMPENHARILLNIAVVKGLADHKGALALLATAERITQEIGQRNLQTEIMGEMITQYKAMGDYKSAFSILEKSQVIRDSIFTLEKEAEIANLQSVYELEKSNQRVSQLEQAEARNTTQRNLIIFIACLLLVAVLTLFSTYRYTAKLNKQLVASQQELQRSGLIKDRIFSIIGHDLRGPIANIPMVIELYRDPRTSEDERAYMLDLLTENSMASLETLDKLLNWGKSQIKGISIQQKQFLANHNLQHQVSLIKGIAANKGITILNNVPNNTMLFADEDHFNFVVRNLLSNAIKFSHKDSTVTLDADKYTRPGFTIFSVQDTGVGIDKEQKTKIFEAFGSSTLGTNNEGGTSIGLMLCKEFVTENGGDIWVESEPGKGATFYFSFRNA